LYQLFQIAHDPKIKIVGCKSEIDKYYDNQESLLKSFAEMDEVTKKGGYFPTTTQVRFIRKLVQKLFPLYIHKLQIYVNFFFYYTQIYDKTYESTQ